MKIALIIKPPVREKIRAIVRQWRKRGHKVSPRLTFERGDAMRFARAAAKRGYDLLIAAGGDGTLNEVVNGIAKSQAQPRLGVLPCGTANDFAMALGIPPALEDAAEAALTGKVLAIDVAEVNTRCFVNVSTGGFGADASQSGQPAKRRLGKLAYFIDGARELAGLHPFAACFSTEHGEVYDGEFTFFAVGNARRTGGGNLITPRADVADLMLDVVIVRALNRRDVLALLPEIRAGRHLDSPDVVYLQTRTLSIESERPLRVNADGEPMLGSKFDYTIRDRSIALMVPQ